MDAQQVLHQEALLLAEAGRLLETSSSSSPPQPPVSPPEPPPGHGLANVHQPSDTNDHSTEAEAELLGLSEWEQDFVESRGVNSSSDTDDYDADD